MTKKAEKKEKKITNKREYVKDIFMVINGEEILIGKMTEINDKMKSKIKTDDLEPNNMDEVYKRKLAMEFLQEQAVMELIGNNVMDYYVNNPKSIKKALKMKGSQEAGYKGKDITIKLNGVEIILAALPQESLRNIESAVNMGKYKNLESGVFIILYNYLKGNSPLVPGEMMMRLLLNGKSEIGIKTNIRNTNKGIDEKEVDKKYIEYIEKSFREKTIVKDKEKDEVVKVIKKEIKRV